MTFDEFWQLYPRKTAKIPATRAWSRVPVSAHDQIKSALERAKTSRQWREGFIPHASTWLNQKRWQDEAAPEREHSEKEQKFLSEYRRRVGWWCRHEPSCEDQETCDDRVIRTWRQRGIV